MDGENLDSYEWVELQDPKSHQTMFVNLNSGECCLDVPKNKTFKPMSPDQWWELYDATTQRNYYYNSHIRQTVWQKPIHGDIIPLGRLQHSQQIFQPPPSRNADNGLLRRQNVHEHGSVAASSSSRRGSQQPQPLQSKRLHPPLSRQVDTATTTTTIASSGGDQLSLPPLLSGRHAYSSDSGGKPINGQLTNGRSQGPLAVSASSRASGDSVSPRGHHHHVASNAGSQRIEDWLIGAAESWQQQDDLATTAGAGSGTGGVSNRKTECFSDRPTRRITTLIHPSHSGVFANSPVECNVDFASQPHTAAIPPTPSSTAGEDDHSATGIPFAKPEQQQQHESPVGSSLLLSGGHAQVVRRPSDHAHQAEAYRVCPTSPAGGSSTSCAMCTAQPQAVTQSTAVVYQIHPTSVVTAQQHQSQPMKQLNAFPPLTPHAMLRRQPAFPRTNPTVSRPQVTAIHPTSSTESDYPASSSDCSQAIQTPVPPITNGYPLTSDLHRSRCMPRPSTSGQSSPSSPREDYTSSSSPTSSRGSSSSLLSSRSPSSRSKSRSDSFSRSTSRSRSTSSEANNTKLVDPGEKTAASDSLVEVGSSAAAAPTFHLPVSGENTAGQEATTATTTVLLNSTSYPPKQYPLLDAGSDAFLLMVQPPVPPPRSASTLSSQRQQRQQQLVATGYPKTQTLVPMEQLSSVSASSDINHRFNQLVSSPLSRNDPVRANVIYRRHPSRNQTFRSYFEPLEGYQHVSASGTVNQAHQLQYHQQQNQVTRLIKTVGGHGGTRPMEPTETLQFDGELMEEPEQKVYYSSSTTPAAPIADVFCLPAVEGGGAPGTPGTWSIATSTSTWVPPQPSAASPTTTVTTWTSRSTALWWEDEEASQPAHHQQPQSQRAKNQITSDESSYGPKAAQSHSTGGLESATTAVTTGQSAGTDSVRGYLAGVPRRSASGGFIGPAEMMTDNVWLPLSQSGKELVPPAGFQQPTVVCGSGGAVAAAATSALTTSASVLFPVQPGHPAFPLFIEPYPWPKHLFKPDQDVGLLMSWTKSKVSKRLLASTDNSLKKQVAEIFKIIQSLMGDRKARLSLPNYASIIVHRALKTPSIRDEIYALLAKQTTCNCDVRSLTNGWALLCTCLYYFPPNATFREPLRAYIAARSEASLAPSVPVKSSLEAVVAIASGLPHHHHQHSRPAKDDCPLGNGVSIPETGSLFGPAVELWPCDRITASHFAQVAPRWFVRSLTVGCRKLAEAPSVTEVCHVKDFVLKPCIFGASLSEVMQIQAHRFPALKVPWIQVFLTEELLRMDGSFLEGIFRLSPDLDLLTNIRCQLEKLFEIFRILSASDGCSSAAQETTDALGQMATPSDRLMVCRPPPAGWSISRQDLDLEPPPLPPPPPLTAGSNTGGSREYLASGGGEPLLPDSTGLTGVYTWPLLPAALTVPPVDYVLLTPTSHWPRSLRSLADRLTNQANPPDAHLAACLLKLWLRELAQPLVPVALQPLCLKMALEAEKFEQQLANRSDGCSEPAVAATGDNPLVICCRLVRQIPPLERRCLLYLILLLQHLVRCEHSTVSRMDARNLATVLAPNLMRSDSTNPIELLDQIRPQTIFVRLLISHLDVPLEMDHLSSLE